MLAMLQQWWLGTVIPSLWWPGALVVAFLGAVAIRLILNALEGDDRRRRGDHH